MLLNIQGRVLFDLILYRRNDDGDRPAVLIECNRDVVSDLLKTLSRYRLRKKIDLTDVTDELQSWAVFCPEHNLTPSLSFNSRARQEDVVICTVDPRLALLGYRVILPSSIDAESVITGGWSCSDDYDTKRCSLGVGEGSVDFPPGQCFPLESNLAFLNGVSFNKGCYIGQELTARTNYTGVIRKRIVPLILPSSATNVKTDAIIINSSGKERGKVRTVSKNLALGLLHISELTEKGSTLHARCGGETSDGSELVEIRAVMPSWWPVASDPIIQQTLMKDAANS
jgi:folate-binding protein YgfZ